MEKEFAALSKIMLKIKQTLMEIVSIYKQISVELLKELKHLDSGKTDVSREVIAIAKINEGEIMETMEHDKTSTASLDVVVGPKSIRKILDSALNICYEESNLHMELFDKIDKFGTSLYDNRDLVKLSEEDPLLKEIVGIWFGDKYETDHIDGLRMFNEQLEKKQYSIGKESLLKSLEIV